MPVGQSKGGHTALEKRQARPIYQPAKAEGMQGTVASSRLLQEATFLSSLHEKQSPLDGNHRSRMAKIPAELPRFSSPEA